MIRSRPPRQIKRGGGGVFQPSLSSLSVISKALVLGYDYTIPESSCADAKTIPDRALVNTHRGGSRGSVQGVRTPPPPPEMTCGFLIQLVFGKKNTMWFIGVEEQETSAPSPKKNPGSAPDPGTVILVQFL